MRPVYYSVGFCVAVGGLFPAWAAALLGPGLAVGLVGLGIAHGACDHLLLPTAPAAAVGWGPWWHRGLLLGYVGLAGAVLAAWFWFPLATLVGFFALSAWHWGSADAALLPAALPYGGRWWVLHGGVRGLLLFAVPALAWPAETRVLCNDLLRLMHGQAIPAGVFAGVATGLGWLTAAGLLMLWVAYGVLKQWQALRTDLSETALLLALLLLLPPVLASEVYFVAWHSLRHILRLLPLLPGRPLGKRLLLGQLLRFWRLSGPLLTLSLTGLGAVAWWLGPTLLAQSGTVAALLLVAASVVTLPHAVLVTGVLDRSRWGSSRENTATLMPVQ